MPGKEGFPNYIQPKYLPLLNFAGPITPHLADHNMLIQCLYSFAITSRRGDKLSWSNVAIMLPPKTQNSIENTYKRKTPFELKALE